MAVRNESVRVSADVSPFIKGMAQASAAAKGFASNLEQSDSRLANLVQTGLALTPALVPIGATAVPAIAGLSTQLGFAVAAAGTAVLAFQGVGDSLKALNEFQLEPSKENFEKLREELDKMAPAGQEFVLFLDSLQPKFQQLKNVAQEGLFPGLTSGLEDLFELQPQFRRIISEIADSTGDLMAEAGDNLNDPRWLEFFNYIETSARPILEDMGRTFGNFTEGLAQMFMAFDPLTQDFSDGFLEMSRSFNDWASGLSESQGFAEFVEYIRETGPQVRETLGAFAEAIIELVKATAPVGAVVLPALEAIADAVSAIASSPAGPALIGIAAGIGAIGRSLAILQAVGGASILAPLTAPLKNAGGAVGSLRSQTAAYLDFGAALDNFGGKAAKAGTAGEALKRSFGTIGRAGAGIAGFGLLMSDLDDGFAASNAAAGALIGTMAGPWGAAIGGAAGLAMDLARTNNDLESSMKNLNLAAEDPYNLLAQRESFNAAQAQLEKYQASLGQANAFSGGGLGDYMTKLGDMFTNSGDEAEAAQAKIEQATLTTEKNIRSLLTIASGTGSDKYQIMPVEQLQEEAAMVEAALGRAGLSIEDFDFDDPEGIREMEAALISYTRATDTVPAKSRAVGEAIRELSSDIMPTVTQAEALKNAMDSLFGPGLNAAAATDAWQQSLADLRSELTAVPDLMANAQPARDARGLIQGSVSSLQDSVAANAADGVGGDKLIQQLLRGRDAIIEQAQAAGIAKKQVADYLDTLGLTPKNLTTIIQASGVLSAKQKVEALRKLYELTPKELRTLVTEAGANPTMAKIKALARQYDLTPKQVQTLLKAIDNASRPTQQAQNEVKAFDKMKGVAALDVAANAAYSAIAAIRGALNNIPDETVYVRVQRIGGTTIRGAGSAPGPGLQRASGGPIIGPGTGTSDSIPLWGSNGEHMWTAREVANAGGHAAVEAIRAQFRYRDGGAVEWERMNAATSSRPITVNAPSQGPLTVVGSIETPWGMREFRGIAREEARAEVKASREHDKMRARAGA